jgi:outer membrane murein-binding lipoprotein Lpp
MKKVAETGIIITLVIALMMLIGCGKSESPQEKYQDQATAKVEEMQKKIEQLKDAYNAKASAMQKEFDDKMAKLKKHYDDGMAELKQKQTTVKQGLADMKSATGDAWEKAKVKMDNMIEDMGKAFEKVKSELEE